MFTGIVEERGHLFWTVDVAEADEDGHGRRQGRTIVVECPKVAAGTEPGDSVAVDGVCLTVTSRQHDSLSFDLSEETIARTTFGVAPPRSRVNLERPATLATRLGGHMMQGHVDGLGTVVSVKRAGEEARMAIRVPDGLSRYLVEKGSVAVDGVSLTVATLTDETFDVALIPHTLAVTTLGERETGDPVNLEVDVLAKYVERLTRRTDERRSA